MDSMINIVKERIEKNRVALLARRRRQYALGRKLGLPSHEAQAVAAWSELRIRAFAEEYHKEK